jgi:hypothetical protein
MAAEAKSIEHRVESTSSRSSKPYFYLVIARRRNVEKEWWKRDGRGAYRRVPRVYLYTGGRGDFLGIQGIVSSLTADRSPVLVGHWPAIPPLSVTGEMAMLRQPPTDTYLPVYSGHRLRREGV